MIIYFIINICKFLVNNKQKKKRKVKNI